MKPYFQTMERKSNLWEAHEKGVTNVFFLCERRGTLELTSRRDALRLIAKHGANARLRAPLTLYYYVPTEDEWYPTELKRNSKVELAGPRPGAVPPFQTMKELLKQMGRSDFTKMSQFMAAFRNAKRAGKFPWIQEPFEIYSHDVGKRGYVPLLELLYALEPESFEVLEHLLDTVSPEKWSLLIVG